MIQDNVAVIPARSGSKGVLKKNIRLLGGYPLIAYTIVAARLSPSIGRIIVSTDSEEIAAIAKSFGAEIPFLRPQEISQDFSTDLEVFQHAIEWFIEKEKYIPELMVHLRPTTPLRDPGEIERAISIVKNRPDCTSLRSVHELAEPPHKVFQIDEKGMLKGFFPDDPRTEYYNLPRQLLPKAYHPNGYVDIVKPDFVKRNHLLHGMDMIAFVTPIIIEVDREEGLEQLEYQLSKKDNLIYKYLEENYQKEK